MEKTTYSYHHFLFPFRWDLLRKGFKKNEKKEEKYTFDERTELQIAAGIIKLTPAWQQKKISGISHHEQYNELTYFHEFVRRAIYDFEKDYSDPVMNYFEYDLATLGNTEFNIFYFELKPGLPEGADKKDKANFITKTITLQIQGITLHLYNTGIGVLSYNLANNKPEQNSPDTILLINELGRRIYPQFLGENNTWDTKRIFLADKIEVGGWKEDFSSYDTLANLSFQKTFLPPAYISKLFSTQVIFNVDEEGLKKNKLLFTRVMDDRMFFLCWYGNNEFANNTGKCYQCDKWWYSYIFGDKSPGGSIANDVMMKKQLSDHTYDRWSRYGTLYGMSRDSFVCLSADAKYLNKWGLPLLDVHMNTIYYQIAVLALVQRASVVKFSAEVAGLADMAKAQSDNSTLNRIKDLYMNYIEFINKIYFREITSQIQGIEIYNQFHKVMRIADDVKDLDGEIQELHNYAEMVKQYQIARRSETLNKVGLPLVMASLIAGILGINFIPDGAKIFGQRMIPEFWKALIPIVGIPILLSLVIMAYRWTNKKRKK
jgi:hypothetical protein